MTLGFSYSPRASDDPSRGATNWRIESMRNALIGALAIAALSTLGDYLWANVLPHRVPIYGLAHGLLLFLAVGVCLGAPAGKPIGGALGGAAIGLASAGMFYVLQPFIGYSALFVLFVALWIGLGVLTGRVLQHRDTMRVVMGRSV